MRLIESIVLRGGGGDDTIDLTTVANTFMQIPVRVEGNDGQDTLEVHADRYTNLAGPNGFTVLGGAGDDTIELESLDDGGIFGGFVLDGESDHDHFIANDLRVGDFGEEVEYTLRSGVIDRGSFGRLPFAGMEEITVNASNLRNIFYVDGTTPNAVTTLNAGYGRDDIFVSSVANSSQAHIHGGGENDYIVVNGDVAGECMMIYGDEDADQIEVLWANSGHPRCLPAVTAAAAFRSTAVLPETGLCSMTHPAPTAMSTRCIFASPCRRPVRFNCVDDSLPARGRGCA